MDEKQFVFNLQRFAEGSDAGSDGGQDGGDGGSAGGAGDAGGDGGKVTFTPEQQAAIERLLKDRLKRAEASAAKRALEEKAKALGYADAAAMEAALEAEKKRADAEKTAQAKAEEEARKLKGLQDQVRVKLLRAEVYAQAVQAGADPELTWGYLQGSGDLADVDPEDAEFAETVKLAVSEAVKAKPALVAQKDGGTGGGTGGNPARGGPNVDQNVERAKAEAARRNAGPSAPSGYDPWSGSSGQQNVEQIASAVAAAVAAALRDQKG